MKNLRIQLLITLALMLAAVLGTGTAQGQDKCCEYAERQIGRVNSEDKYRYPMKRQFHEDFEGYSCPMQSNKNFRSDFRQDCGTLNTGGFSIVSERYRSTRNYSDIGKPNWYNDAYLEGKQMVVDLSQTSQRKII